jgi:cardiolipin synthase
MPVSALAKWKTGLQMTALPVLLVGTEAPTWLPAQAIGEIFLWAAAGLTLITGWDYLRAGLKHMQEPAS